MDMSIQLSGGSRKYGGEYALWVFENGDWYLREGGKTGPEYIPKD